MQKTVERLKIDTPNKNTITDNFPGTEFAIEVFNGTGTSIKSGRIKLFRIHISYVTRTSLQYIGQVTRGN